MQSAHSAVLDAHGGGGGAQGAPAAWLRVRAVEPHAAESCWRGNELRCFKHSMGASRRVDVLLGHLQTYTGATHLSPDPCLRAGASGRWSRVRRRARARKVMQPREPRQHSPFFQALAGGPSTAGGCGGPVGRRSVGLPCWISGE